MKYSDSIPKKWKVKQKELLDEIKEEREKFYYEYRNKVKKTNI